jgi:type IV pilus biogenesis protein PilP
MYANSPTPSACIAPAVRKALLCLLLLPGLTSAVLAQAQKPAADTLRGSTAGAPPEAPADGEEERARILRKIANDIAYLRQQQALVEAQSALAKARAELASINAGAAQANTGSQIAGAPAVPSEKVPGRNDVVTLTGIQGDSKRRWASVKVGEGPVKQVEAGSAVGGWTVVEVRLNEVLLRPTRGGEPTLLRVEGSVQRAPGVAPAARKPARSARAE